MSVLKPGESLKITSKAFDIISNQIKTKLSTHDKSNNTLENIFKIQILPSQIYNTENIREDLENGQNHAVSNGEKEELDGNILSKFIVTEKYGPTQFQRVKDGINFKVMTEEIKKEVCRRHYSAELNRWQKKSRSYKEYEQSIAKVTTHPKGKEELENKKLLTLKQKIATNIPEPSEKQVIYLRSELKHSEDIDIYLNDVWRFRDIQRFLTLFFEHHKNFAEIQNKLPDKKTHEIIALYDLLKPVLDLKKFYKKGKQKPSSARKEYFRTILPKIKEKLLYLLKEPLVAYNATQMVINLGEAKLSRRDIINCVQKFDK